MVSDGTLTDGRRLGALAVLVLAVAVVVLALVSELWLVALGSLVTAGLMASALLRDRTARAR